MKSSRVSTASLMFLALVSAVVLLVVRPYVSGSRLTVRAVAHQWWWEFDYPSLGVKTSNVLYLPSDSEVQLELRSADSIHSFWIAGMKKSVDIIPGEAHLLDVLVKSPGELYGNCDSGCGCGTVCMRFRVLISAPLEFERWAVNEQSRRAEFEPPRTANAPVCALNTGHDRQFKPNSPATRLQHLLDRN